ncbi:hypothetical protein ACJ41O_001559 [Fusarium nematophilum]
MDRTATTLHTRDFMGLREVCPAQGPQVRYTHDLVAVHGLGGGSISTWTSPDGSCWLDWLAKDIPCLRILAFGYRPESIYLASQSEQSSSGDVFSDAQNLLGELSDNRTMTKQHNPISFLCYDIGGIVVKQALVLAMLKKTQYRDILNRTHHIIFLETPHGGLCTEGWWDIYGSVASTAGETQFRTWSASLDQLANQFAGIVNKVAITSVRAGLAVRMRKKTYEVVPAASVFLNADYESSITFSEDSHLTICKCSSPSDYKYERLQRRIRAEMDASPACLRREVFRKIKKWLESSVVSQISYKEDLSLKSTAVDGTCQWLPRLREYQEWAASPISRFAWLHGIQGCGKTTLIGNLIKSLQHQEHRVLSIFCQDSAKLELSDRINCLTLQMAEADEQVLMAILPNFEKSRGTSLRSPLTAATIFRKALRAFGQCFVFLDALDECAQDDREFLARTMLEVVHDVPEGVKLMCASRNEPDLLHILSHRPDVTDFPIRKDDNMNDITLMVHAEIDKQPNLAAMLAESSDQLREDIVSNLMLGANGMFLLPKLMIKELDSKMSSDEIYMLLADLPTDLHEHYIKAAKRIPNDWRPRAKQIIAWTAWARRPLRVEELRDALEFHTGDQIFHMAGVVKAACSGLVVVEDGEVKFNHSSVRRFIRASVALREDSCCRQLLVDDADDLLAETCTRYIFGGDYYYSLEQFNQGMNRFADKDPQPLKKTCPFLEYASHYWISHCRESRSSTRFVQPILNFVHSRHFWEWCEALGHFSRSDSEPLRYYFTFLQTFVNELKFRLDEQDGVGRGMLESTSTTLSKIRGFLWQWEDAVTQFPREVYHLSALIGNPNVSRGSGRQDIVFTGRCLYRPEHLHDMLECKMLNTWYDRFLLGDLNIFMWQSLMPSTPWDRAHQDSPLKLDVAEEIRLRTESIVSAQDSAERYGIDPADVGSIQACTVLSDDLRAVAITWARFSPDKAKPIDIKTYAWLLHEQENSVDLERIRWTDLRDPCRVDKTSSHAFKKSKCPLAFAIINERRCLWTAGGRYDLETGFCTPPPFIFRDRTLSEMTFAADGSVIAGIRDRAGLEVFKLPQGRCIAAAPGACSILAVSPRGRFVLFLKKPDQAPGRLVGSGAEDLFLLRHGSPPSRIWTYREKPADVVDLEYFYNNGGLYSFSSKESLLVVCVPEDPEWVLLVFNLAASDIAASVQTITCSHLLQGADILSFTFCPTHEKRIYVLSSTGTLRILDISGQHTTSGSSTAGSLIEYNRPVLSALLNKNGGLELITSRLAPQWGSSREEIRRLVETSSTKMEMVSWGLKDFTKVPTVENYTELAATLALIKSRSLTVDLQPLINSPDVLAALRGGWGRVSLRAQASIEDTAGSLKWAFGDNDMSSEPPSRDLEPRVSTNVTFGEHGRLGFFQSAIYHPLPTFHGQPMYDLTMIMDIRHLPTSKGRKTGNWGMAVIGTVKEEFLACTYHEGQKLLAYSVSVRFTDKSEESPNWFISRLCLSHLGARPDFDLDFSQDPNRATYIRSQTYSLAYPGMSSWLFSPCGRHLYGISHGWPPRIVQFDTWRRRVVRTVYDPFRMQSLMPRMTLRFYNDELYAVADRLGVAVLVRLPFGPDPDPARYARRYLAAVPSDTQNCESLRILFPESPGDDQRRYLLVGQGTNYLRKNGVVGGNTQWPFAVAVKERDLGEWTVLEEAVDPVNLDNEEGSVKEGANNAKGDSEDAAKKQEDGDSLKSDDKSREGGSSDVQSTEQTGDAADAVANEASPAHEDISTKDFAERDMSHCTYRLILFFGWLVAFMASPAALVEASRTDSTK